MLQDDNVRESQLEDNAEIAAVPDPVCEGDEGDLILRENEEIVDELVLDPDQEAEDYIQQHSPEINQEQEGLDLAVGGTDHDADDVLEAEVDSSWCSS